MAWDKIKDGLKDVAAKGTELAGEGLANAKEKQAEKREQRLEDKQELKEKIAKMDKEGTVYCPKCYSTNISANKRGFKMGRAVVAGTLTFGVGLLAGAAGKNKVEVTCLKCGHTWKAGK